MMDAKTKFTNAYIREYCRWLLGYLKSGGEATHYYSYPWARANFLLANKDFRVYGECGAMSRPVIVPEGVQFLGGDLGHNTIYFMDDFRLQGSWVPIYEDVDFLFIGDGILLYFIEEQKRKQKMIMSEIANYKLRQNPEAGLW